MRTISTENARAAMPSASRTKQFAMADGTSRSKHADDEADFRRIRRQRADDRSDRNPISTGKENSIDLGDATILGSELTDDGLVITLDGGTITLTGVPSIDDVTFV